MALTPICHVGKECAPGPVIELGKRFQMDIKPVVLGVEDPLRGEVRKQEALLAVSKAAGNPKQEQMLYFNAHGGPNHIWLAKGEIGREVDRDLHVPAAISYRELASSVIQAAPTKGNELDLSHLRMTFDTCISGDFARRFLDDLSQLAGEQGKKIVGYPLVISSAQRGSVAFTSRLDRSSYLQVAIGRLPEAGSRILGDELYKLDRLLNQLTAAQGNTLGEQMGVQDIAVFSPLPQQQSLTEDVVRRVEEEGLKISKEPKPRSLDDIELQRRESRTLISPLGKDSPLGEGRQNQDPESGNEGMPKEVPPPLNPQRSFFNSEISSLVLPPAPRPERNG